MRSPAAVLLPVLVLVAAVLLAATPSSGQVTLLPTTSPSSGSPGISIINATGSGFPSGTIVPSSITVTVTPKAGGTAATTHATAVTTILGSTRRVTFILPASISLAKSATYLVTVSGKTTTGIVFSSKNSSQITVNPAAPAVTLSAASQTFPAQVISQSSPTQSFTVSNTGNSPLTITSIAISGANPAEFTQTNNCPMSPKVLVAGGVCTVQTAFAPLGVGTRTASVTLTDNAGNVVASQQSEPLTGTASAPPPQTYSKDLTFPVGNNVTQVATLVCPSGTNPCTDPQAHSFKLTAGAVTNPFTLTIQAFEVPLSQANGICENGNDETNDFDCRFTQYFAYQTMQNGDIVVPQCIPYSNGNCVFYRITNVPPYAYYSGGLLQTIAWNNSAFVPPPFYQANNPRLFDDPSAPPYNVNHQFVFDITSYFNSAPGKVGDPIINGKTVRTNDFGVAWPSALPSPPYTFVFQAPLGSGTPSFTQGANILVSFSLTQNGTVITNALTPPNAVDIGLHNSAGTSFQPLAPNGSQASFTFNSATQTYDLTLSTTSLPPGTYTVFVNSNLFLQQSASFTIATTAVVPTILLDPVSVTVAPGQTANFVANASGVPAPTVQWQVSTNGGVSFSNISGATSTVLSIVTALSQNGNEYQAVFTNASGSATTTPATLSVVNLPVVTSNPVSTAQTPGANVTLTAVANNATSVQWQVSTNAGTTFTPIPGATSTTYTFVATAAEDGNVYDAVFTNASGTATTTGALLTVGSSTAPVVTANPSNQSVAAGTTATFTAAAAGSPTPTVQWQVSTNGGTTYTNIPGATSATLSFTTTAAENGNLYQALFTNVNGSAASASALLTVSQNSAPFVTMSPMSQTVPSGQTAMFTAAATGAPTPTVQWQVSTDGGKTFSNIAGANSTTLSFTAAISQNGNEYQAIFTNSTSSVSTTPATLTVTANNAPVITANPASQTVTSGQTATFTASATGIPAPTVQWQVSTNGGATFTSIAGATNTTLSFTAAPSQNGNMYKALFTNTGGSTATSAATLTVNTAPSITLNPVNTVASAGSIANYTAAASGNPTPTVQWQISTNAGTTFTNIPGATSTTYSFTATLGQNGDQYRAVFTNSVSSATTTAATLTVTSAPVITTNPSNVTVNAGQTAMFTAAASGSPTPTVQWQVSANGGVTFANLAGQTSGTLTFTANSSQNGNLYQAVFTNTGGSTATLAATLTVNSAPVITTNPVPVTVAAGSTATFTAAASGVPAPTVQWQVSTNGGASYSNVPGATSTTLSFTAAAGQNGNLYRAVFANSVSSTTTTAAMLTVTTPPVVTSNPINTTVNSGQTATFTAAASGVPAPTVQWQVSTNGGGTFTNISGATSTSYSTVASVSQNANQFRAVFTNTGGSATTAAATLTVIGAPATVSVNAGNNQSTPINAAFTIALQVLVVDSNSNPVTGVNVTFTAPNTAGATGTFSGSFTTSATTNASGLATAATLTANGVAGTFFLNATVSGVASPATFTLNNTTAAISTLLPNSGILGQTLTVALTGVNSHFAQGTTTANFGTGITLNILTVSSLTSASANITIAPTTSLGPRTVTLTTGAEAASFTNGFKVNQGNASLVSATPNGGAQATGTTVAIVGSLTNFAQGVTVANFGPNITVNSVTVVDLTHANVNISISGSATLGAQTITMTTGGEVASLTNGFTITAGTPVVLSVSPAQGTQGDTSDTITVFGQATHFVQGTTSASFGPGIIVNSVTINSATQAVVNISISTTAAPGNRMVTMTTGAEVANSPANAFVVNAGTPTVTVAPNFGIQGGNILISVTGSYTHFVQGTTTANFGAGDISAGAVTVNSPTQASVQIQISTIAILGTRTITITTGAENATGSFTVTAGVPVITSVNPNVGGQGVASLTVIVNANFTSWVNGATVANFGPGVHVGGAAAGANGPVTVNNAGQFTATIAIDSTATLGPRTITVTTGASQQTAAGAFTVANCTTTPASVLYVSPANGTASVVLNPVVQWEFNAPLNRSTITASSVTIQDAVTAQFIPSTATLDVTGRIVTVTPQQLLPVHRLFYLYLGSQATVTDACGNTVTGFSTFTTGYGTRTAGPNLLLTSPMASATNVPLNAVVDLGFDEPVNPITLINGVTVSAGGTAVLGSWTFAPDYSSGYFTPGTTLTASTTYTVTYASSIVDASGNGLANPGSFTFTTGTTSNTTGPQVVATDPVYGEMNVGTNVTVHFYLNGIIDPVGVAGSTAVIYNANTGKINAGTVSVSANRMEVTVTPTAPNAPLQPGTTYYGYLAYGASYFDVSHNYGQAYAFYFTTGGNGQIISGPTVVQVSPPNGTTGAPVNTQVVAVMSSPIDPNTVNNMAIAVTPQGSNTPVAGTVSVATDQVTITFMPAANLAMSTTYNITVGGFQDVQGNTVVTFSSSFTTGSNGTAVPPGSLTAVSVTPANGATGVSTTTQISIFFSEVVDPATVTNILVRDQSNGYYGIAGTWAVDPANGAHVTFTPTSPLPPNSAIQVWTQDLVQDLAGNTDTAYVVTTFTTGSGSDTTPFTVTSITPVNGATGVGRNQQVALTFSKSVNQLTVTYQTIQVFNGVSAIYPSFAFSQNGRTLVLTSTWPANATITVVVTSGVQDFFRNAVTAFEGQFTTAVDLTTTGPSVVTQRPAYGATDVPVNAVITLFTNSQGLNSATIAPALHVSQNGVLINGTVNLIGNNQAIEFISSSNFNYGDLIQIFLDGTVQDNLGNFLNPYSGQFTVQGNPANTAPQLVAVNPKTAATSVATNVLPQLAFDQLLLASTITSTNAYLYDGTLGANVSGTVSLINTGNAIIPSVIQFKPAAVLPASHVFYFYLTNGVTNPQGTPVTSGTTYFTYFTTGTTTDTTVPTVQAVSPPNGTSNIGINALIQIQFSKRINPLSLATVTVTGGGQTVIPVSVSLQQGRMVATFTPQAPLPPSTLMTITINGVTDEQGNTVTPFSSTFTTGPGADTTAPQVIQFSPAYGATGVPTNTAIVVKFSKPMNTATLVNNGVYTFYLYDGVTGLAVPTTVSYSTDLTTATMVPTAPLGVNRFYYVYAYNALDLVGNPQVNNSSYFVTAYNTSATVPQVLLTNPENGLTTVPTNTVVQVLFNEPVDPATLSQLQLMIGGAAVPTTASLSNGNMVVSLTPTALLQQNTTYTISVAGVMDYAGHSLSAPVNTTFVTGTVYDLVSPSIAAVDPVNGSTGVGTNPVIRVHFSKRLNPISLKLNPGYLQDYYTGRILSGATQTISADRMSVTYTLNGTLQPYTQYYAVQPGPYSDVAGNLGGTNYTIFTTGRGPITSGPTVVSVSPPNGTAGTPVNTVVVAVMSAPLDPGSVTNAAITVTPQGSATAVAGTVTLAADQVTLTFVPAASLAVSTVYNVSVGGVLDPQGNASAPFASTFTTGANSIPVAPGSLTVVSFTPSNGATGVSTTSVVDITFSEVINPATVNNILIRDASNGYYGLSGAWVVDPLNGAHVTWTPNSPMPANSSIQVWTQDLVQDFAGNTDTAYVITTFTTGSGSDTTPPTVTSVTPTNGASNLGHDVTVVLTFSKSINPATVTNTTITLLAGDKSLGSTPSISQNGRTATFFVPNLPASSTITVVATSSVQDLYGNNLVPFSSQFTTAIDPTATGPAVVTQVPGNGATDVPTSAVITLYTNGTALNPATVPGALHVSQNGVLVAGTATVTSGGNAIVFTPSSGLAYGNVVQVVLDQAATDTAGNPLQFVYTGSFTIQGNPSSVAPQLILSSPAYGTSNVPLNVIPQLEFDQALQGTTIVAPGVYLYDATLAANVSGTVSLMGPNSNVIQFKPAAALTASHIYYFYVNGVTNTLGTPLSGGLLGYFVTGTTTNTTAPSVVAVGPPNNSTGAGVNTKIIVNFSAPINPISVNGTTIQVTGGGQTVIPASISFALNNGYFTALTMVTITPLQPLPASTSMAIAINGVTDAESNAVTAQTTHFTTSVGPNLNPPMVTYFSALSGDTVPTNAVFSIEFNEPIDPGSVSILPTNSSGYLDFWIYDYTMSTYLGATASQSPDLKTVTLTPAASLTTGHTIGFGEISVTDLSGNSGGGNSVGTLAVAAGPDTTPPTVVQVSPPANLTGTPLNTIVQLLFSKEIAANTQSGVQLSQSGTPIQVIFGALGLHNTIVTMTPAVPLAPNTTYTISATGVTDITGNALSGFTSQTFTTGGTFALSSPSIVSVTPANGAISVSASTTIQIQFSAPMDPISFNQAFASSYTSGAQLLVNATSAVVPCTVSFSPDFKTVTLTPTAPGLASATQYRVYIPGYYGTDFAGNGSNGLNSYFTTM